MLIVLCDQKMLLFNSYMLKSLYYFVSTLDQNDDQSFFQRRKRDLSEKSIEIAVFVDDELYQKTVKDGATDPIEDIQNLVFAYMNSVSETSAKPSQCIKFFDEKYGFVSSF